MQQVMHVVPRSAIPPIQAIEQGGKAHELGELRDFRWNDKLREFMPPSSKFSVSWVRLEEGEVLHPHVHPIQSLMVFYAGSGRILGDLEGVVTKDDVVVVPAGCKHGFVGGPQGLYGLSIQFGEGLYSTPESPRVVFAHTEDSLDSLLAYNARRAQEFADKPVFSLLRDGTLEDPRKRQAYLDALQIWVDGNQTLLFSRQASCMDPKYQSVFLQHMQEELGHDLLHKDRADEQSRHQGGFRDSIMEAITNWFAYQMYVLDNSEKAAIIHLVIENASATYHKYAMPALGKYVNEHYFEVHVHADEEHAALGVELLRKESARTYKRLRFLVGEAWDMVGAMTDRLVEITRSA